MDDSERGTPALRPGSGRGPRSHRRGGRRHGKARAARTALSSRRPGGPLAEVASATGAQGPELERDHPHAKGRDQRSHFANAQPQAVLGGESAESLSLRSGGGHGGYRPAGRNFPKHLPFRSGRTARYRLPAVSVTPSTPPES